MTVASITVSCFPTN